MLARVASYCVRHRRRVVLLWVAALVATFGLVKVAGGEHRVDYAMPGSQSGEVRDLLAAHFPERAGDLAYLVARSEAGIDDAAVAQRLAALTGAIAASEHIRGVDPATVSSDGRTAIVPVQFDLAAESLPPASVSAVMRLTQQASGDGLQLELGGYPVQNTEGAQTSGETFGLLAAAVILLFAFGSALAAGIPLAMALCGLGVGAGLVMLIANAIDIPDWGSSLATMIGIGVGVDYALFILTRYRAALADGHAPAQAVVTAMTTSGRAVLFAGGTVVVSLLGLGTMGLEYLWGAAIAMVAAVLAVLAASMTLLPAVLGFAGRGIDRLRIPGTRPGARRSARWAQWSERVQHRPVVFGGVGFVVLVALALPLFGLRFGFPDAGTGPTSLTSRRAFDLVAQSFGPGANGPLEVVVERPAGDTAPVAEGLATSLRAEPGVAAVLPVAVARDGRAATITVVPATGPQDAATEALVHRLRDSLPGLASASGARVVVGGITALFIDEAAYEGARLPWFIGAVIVVSFVLLLCVFRSVLVATKAALLNVLAIGAAYGVISLAAQGGRFGRLIGIHEATPVPVWVPILMFALLFGLSMDYEVFLLSRIREEHLAGHPNERAVTEGIASTARVITAAAAIMVTVFGAYVFADQAFMKLAGLGMATAVFVDATIVRMVLVPATMQLLGERNWWVPQWLDRILPRFDVEPAQATAVGATAADGQSSTAGSWRISRRTMASHNAR